MSAFTRKFGLLIWLLTALATVCKTRANTNNFDNIFKLNINITNFECEKTDKACNDSGGEVAIAQSEDQLKKMVKHFCQENDTKGLVLRLNNSDNFTENKIPCTSSVLSQQLLDGGHSCYSASDGSLLRGCKVACSQSDDEHTIPKSVLCMRLVGNFTATSSSDTVAMTPQLTISATSCNCCQQEPPSRLPEMPSTEDRDKLLEKLRKELTLNKSSLSRTRTRKTSATDDRHSSQFVGSVAILLVVIVLGLIVISDLCTFWHAEHAREAKG